jgi:hypothetical protein
LNLRWLGSQPCLEPCGPRSLYRQLRGPYSLLLLQKFDGIGRGLLDCSAITANDDPRVQMGASMLIEDPPTPSHPAGARILTYLYTVFMWFPHAGVMTPPMPQDKGQRSHVPVI